MPRVRNRQRLQTDPRAIPALLYGAPLGGIDHRRRTLFWGGFYSLDELAMLRSLWRQHRDELTAQFQKMHPGELPWAAIKFDSAKPALTAGGANA